MSKFKIIPHPSDNNPQNPTSFAVAAIVNGTPSTVHVPRRMTKVNGYVVETPWKFPLSLEEAEKWTQHLNQMHEYGLIDWEKEKPEFRQ